jgi:hypothetical protein
MKNLDDDTITWLYRVTDEEDIQSSSTVCRACNMYIQRHKGDDTCTRWKREVPHLKQKCIVKGCGCESARKGAVTVGIVSNILGDVNHALLVAKNQSLITSSTIDIAQIQP